MPERDRKAEHIELALDPRTQVKRSWFDDHAFVHEALPECALEEVDTSCTFLGKPLKAPLLISCMTGGTGQASAINRNLAIAAQSRGVAIGVGSQRKALEDPTTAATFEIREHCPDVPLIGNLGAVQLNYGYGLAECERAVEMVGADALVFHLNPLQEALQPEGQTDFRSLLPKLSEICGQLSVPAIAKEVGSGLSEATGRALVAAGIRVLDVAGVGGTSWARIEAARAEDLEIGELFAAWGIPTPDSIRELARIEEITVIGSGGVRSGLDVAKAIALGADLGGLAQRFLSAAIDGPGAVEAVIDRTVRELKIAMFCAGARDLAELKTRRLLHRPVAGPREI